MFEFGCSNMHCRKLKSCVFAWYKASDLLGIRWWFSGVSCFMSACSNLKIKADLSTGMRLCLLTCYRLQELQDKEHGRNTMDYTQSVRRTLTKLLLNWFKRGEESFIYDMFGHSYGLLTVYVRVHRNLFLRWLAWWRWIWEDKCW